MPNRGKFYSRLVIIKHAHVKCFYFISGLRINANFQRKIVYIFLPISLIYVMDAQTNRLNKMVPLSTQNICS